MMNRPFITLNMASSVDGKITTAQRDRIKLGSAEDHALMQELRARADAILIGKGNLIDEDPCLILTQPDDITRYRQLTGHHHPINILVTSSLHFSYENSDFFNHPQTRKMVFTSDTDVIRCEALKKYAQVIFIPADANGKVDLEQVIIYLSNLGIRHLLLEGGGILNFSMLKLDLIDEFYLTLCPLIIGGKEAPTAFEGCGFTQETLRRLKLVSCRVNDFGEIFLRYLLSNRSV